MLDLKKKVKSVKVCNCNCRADKFVRKYSNQILAFSCTSAHVFELFPKTFKNIK